MRGYNSSLTHVNQPVREVEVKTTKEWDGKEGETEEDAVPPEAAAPFEQFSYQDAGSVMTTSSIHSRTSLPMTALSE